MTRKCKVLIVDDHPLICDSYKSALEEVGEQMGDVHLQIDIASDCDSALEKIRNKWTDRRYDLVFYR